MKKIKSKGTPTLFRFLWTHCLMLASLPLLSGCYVGGNVLSSGSYLISAIQDFTVQDGGATGFTEAMATALDSSGNSYSTGYTTVAMDGQTEYSGGDFFLTKYNSLGVRQWTIQDGPSLNTLWAQGLAVAVDTTGYVYVAGVTNGAIDGQTQHGTYDLFITKYSAAGVRQWTIQDGIASGSTYAYGLAVDSTTGSIYAVGYTTKGIDGQTQHGNYDYFITKYNSSGTRQWTVQDGTASAYIEAWAVAFDPTGYIYITGGTNKSLDGQPLHGSSSDIFISKYNTSGTRQWTVQDGAASGQSIGYGIVLDSSSNVYVAGFTNVALDGQTMHGTFDFILTKYNSAGTRQWTTQDGGASGSAAQVYIKSLALDSSNNIYACGYTYHASFDGYTLQGISDLFVTKYNSTGTRQWTVTEGGSGGQSAGNAIAVDSVGNVYLAGTTSVPLNGQTQNGDSDFLLMQFKSTGSQ